MYLPLTVLFVCKGLEVLFDTLLVVGDIYIADFTSVLIVALD